MYLAASLYSLLLLVVSCAAAGKHLVTFGDSYTDQSRLSYYSQNKSAPPPHYQELYPPLAYAANGGTTWVRYAERYGNLTAYNYAVSGAACSNLLTGRPGIGPASYPSGEFPSVIEDEIPSFTLDWITNTSSGSHNQLDPSSTYYSLWIGTNDLGFGSLLTGNQTAGVTIVNVTECGIQWMKELYKYGARKFIFMNLLPLFLTPLYSALPAPLDRYWPYPHNRTQYSIEMMELTMAGNALWDLQVPAALWSMPGASAAVFSSFDLFWDMYHNPSAFLNGSAPLNVTSYDAMSINGTTVVNSNKDSFLWYDSLHPSEQADRNVAREIVATIEGTSKYATYYRWR